MDILSHKNLTCNVAFNELPEWFQNESTENAKISYENGLLTWHVGTWHDGTWHDGIRHDGFWHDGVWHDGFWHVGFWHDGVWHDGVWHDGVWYSGYKNVGFCKWKVFYCKDSIKIGCYEKTIQEWDLWFAGSEVYKTPRDTDEFKRIYESYLLAKFAIENKL